MTDENQIILSTDTVLGVMRSMLAERDQQIVALRSQLIDVQAGREADRQLVTSMTENVEYLRAKLMDLGHDPDECAGAG